MSEKQVNDCELIASTMGTLRKLLDRKDMNLLFTYVHLKYWIEASIITKGEYDNMDEEFFETNILSGDDHSKALQELREMGIFEDDDKYISIK